MFKVCRDDMPCEVKKKHTCVFFWGCRKKWKNSLSDQPSLISLMTAVLYTFLLDCTGTGTELST